MGAQSVTIMLHNTYYADMDRHEYSLWPTLIWSHDQVLEHMASSWVKS